jgi:hypothetical protein
MARVVEDLIQGLREFPANMRELLTTPRTLIIFLVGVGFLIFVSTNPLMFSIFPWIILFFGYMAYNVHLYHKAGYVLDRKRKVVLAITCSLVLTLSIYGYEIAYVNDIDLARVPKDILQKNHWARFPEQDRSEALGGYLVRVEVRAYRYEYNNPQAPPYPGAIWLITLKTVFVPGQDLMKQEVQKQIDSFKMEGLTIDQGSRTSGNETLGNGHTAGYAEYQALLGGSGSGFFGEISINAKIKIRAEWWACSEHGTAIVVIGASQWGVEPGTDRFGRLIPAPPNDYETEYSVQRIIYNILCA